MPGRSLDGARPELLTAEAALRAVVAQEHPGLLWQIADYGGMRNEEYTKTILQDRVNDWAVAIRHDPSLPKRTTMERWRKIAPFGHSMHNYGAAFDVEVIGTQRGISGLQALNILKDYAPVVGLIDGRDFGDPPHFELPGGLDAAKAAWEKQTGTKIFTA